MSKYCLSVDGAGVGTLSSTCPNPKPGQPIPYSYIIGPKSTDAGAQPYCASTDPTTQVQSFTKGACASESANAFTFYTYGSPITGQPPLCFMPAPAGIKGTIVTTLPDQGAGCTMNLNVKYQNVTCAETGCGDHGNCVSGVCVCAGGWSGTQCQSPPSGNAGCTPGQSCGNQGFYGVCEAANSAKTGGITGSGKCTCNTLAGQKGTFCEQACSPGDSTACGGPLRGLCVDNMYQAFTNPNSVQNRCACVNGWSGFSCDIPPPNWQCNNTDQQCTNITTLDPTKTVATGVCNNGTCTCNNSQDCGSTNSFGSAFTGKACQTPLSSSGTPCEKDEQCNATNSKCVNNVCTCPGDPTPDPTIDYVKNMVMGLLQTLSTPEGLGNFAGTIAIHAFVPRILKYMAVKSIQPGFQSSIMKRLESGALGETLGKDAARVLEDSVGKEMAAKLLTKMTGKQLMEATAESASKMIAETVLKDSFGVVLGPITSIVDTLGMLGMVLDGFDVLGMQEKTNQDMITAIMKKFEGFANSNKTIVETGAYFPTVLRAESTFPFREKTVTDAVNAKFAQDMGDYIGHLTVNSNGALIVPLFQTPSQNSNAQALAQAQGTLLYSVAGQNLQVYQRLKDYWPAVVAGGLILLGIIIGTAFGIRALVKKNLPSNK